MSARPMTPHRLAGATTDWSAIGSYQRKRVDLYQQLRSRSVPDEPHKSEWRYAFIGAASALLWILIISIADGSAAEWLRGVIS